MWRLTDMSTLSLSSLASSYELSNMIIVSYKKKKRKKNVHDDEEYVCVCVFEVMLFGLFECL